MKTDAEVGEVSCESRLTMEPTPSITRSREYWWAAETRYTVGQIPKLKGFQPTGNFGEECDKQQPPRLSPPLL